MPTNLKSCSNCEQQFYESYAYCPYCGQKSKEELTLGILFNNTISNYFSVDARFFKSFIPLMIKPGYLAKRFIGGKRLLYLHPAQMYLFISVVFFFLFSFVANQQARDIDTSLKENFEHAKVVMDSISQKPLDSTQLENYIKPYTDNKEALGLTDKETQELDSIIKNKSNSKPLFNSGFNQIKIDSLINAGASDKIIYKEMGLDENASWVTRKFYEQALKFYKSKSGGSILKRFYDTIPIAMFFLLPIFALLLKLFYYRKGAYAYHLVFSFYFFAYLFTVFSILLLCNFIWANFPGWLMGLIMLSTFIYFFIAVKRFYEQGWILSYIKSSFIVLFFFTLLIPITIFLGFFAFMYY
ncbi:DUF3667 domain-containing protein [Mangrovimonas spongiae]|uniref:DUF3667 domain-containing protein n=1 Tax=Mangrovimonas spongiae TaxID=2494697 RepID=A0A3R9URP4_9FLAO|nr:DUF3667 domain-containing protein [Mangrovimonas spongiae]RSK38746.1 DUF3667 domain-containing protein [Mangrovimonas spongiae]